MPDDRLPRSRPSDRQIRLKAVALIAAAAVLAILGVGAAERMTQRASLADARADAIGELSGLRSRIESKLNADVQLTRGMVSYVKVHPDLQQWEFDLLASDLVASGESHIRNLALARDLVISHVYPLAGNEPVLGLDYRNLPAQWPLVEQAVREKRIVIAGPLELVQGGIGLISRFPVFLDLPRPPGEQADAGGGEPTAAAPLWGIISTVIDFDAFLRGIGMDAYLKRFRVVMIGRDGTGGQGPAFWGDRTVLQEDPVRLTIDLVSGEWNLAAVPVGGWPTWSRRATLIVVLAAGLFLLALAIVLWQMRSELAQARSGRLLETARNEAVVARIAAERASAAKSHFLANMSHDLRTPLNSIVGFSEIIRRQVFGPGWQPKYNEYIGHIHDCGLSLVAMIGDILDLAKIETEDYQIHLETIDMPVLLGDVAASWRARLGSPARLDLDVAADAPPILEGDRRALQRILDNLLSNAQHYAGDGARIELSWSVLPGGGASLTVRDDGPGIPAEQIPNLAEPFYQGGTDHDRHSEQARQSSGHGLGLSIVRRLAELHGGALRIESVQGQGASFAVTFPADRLSWQWQAPPAPAGAGKGPPDGGSAAAG